VALQELRDLVAAKDKQITAAKAAAKEAQDAAQHDRESAQRQQAASQKSIDELKAQLESTKTELRSATADLKFAKDVTNAHATSKGSLEGHVARVEKDKAAADQRADEAEAAKRAAEESAEALQAKLDAATKRIDDLEIEVDMLHRHQVAPAPVDDDDASPPPKTKGADEEAVEALQHEVAELKRRNASLLSDKESIQRHLTAAMSKQQTSSSDPSSNAESKQELDQARRQCDALREELTAAEDRYKCHNAALSTMLFQASQRNLALALELHRHTEKVPRMFAEEDLYAEEDDDAQLEMDFLTRSRRQLEMGPLLEVE
jgi:chromosome segregation ATPase